MSDLDKIEELLERIEIEQQTLAVLREQLSDTLAAIEDFERWVKENL